MTNVYFDSEFIDTGREVKLLSIGMVRDDGAEYYAINNSYWNLEEAAKIPWLRENVLDVWPLVRPMNPALPNWDESHPDFKYVKRKSKIAQEVRDFILAVPDPSLWAWFSAYDHLMLSQLYGRMLDIPAGIPQRTNDVAQEAERLKARVPSMPGAHAHHPLHDAREVKYRYDWLERYEITQKLGWTDATRDGRRDYSYTGADSGSLANPNRVKVRDNPQA